MTVNKNKNLASFFSFLFREIWRLKISKKKLLAKREGEKKKTLLDDRGSMFRVYSH
jgi:hypothetical protein